MKNIIILSILILAGCHTHDDDYYYDDYYYPNYSNTRYLVATESYGDLAFYTYRCEYYGGVSYEVTMKNVSYSRIYTFTYQLQLCSSGAVVDATPPHTVYDLGAQQAYTGDSIYISSRGWYPEPHIVVTDVVFYTTTIQ